MSLENAPGGFIGIFGIGIFALVVMTCCWRGEERGHGAVDVVSLMGCGYQLCAGFARPGARVWSGAGRDSCGDAAMRC